jgi:flagellar basal-body rod protein FlgB
MSPIHLFDLAQRRNDWLARQQAVIAGNIANANTPGFKTREIAPFEEMLASALPLAATHAGHLQAVAAAPAAPAADRADASGETFHSGNDVSLEQEFMKAGDVMRAYSLNTGLIKSFHRLLLASAKG